MEVPMAVSIDKVSLIHTITDKDHYNTIILYVHVLKEEYKGKGYFYWKTKYSINVKVKLDEHCDLLIRAGTSNSKLYVKFEFNAGKVSKEGWENLNLIFSLIFEDGYKTAYENLRVDYLEIAVDFIGIELNQIYAIDYKVRQFSDFYKPDGSIYYGAKKSKRGYIIYDKAKQLKEVKGIILNYPLLRVECRLRLPNIKVKDIGNIKNPFIPLRIFEISKQHLLAKGSSWKKFYELVLEKGLDAQAAYLSLNPIERQSIDSGIFLCRFPWWDPSNVWELAKEKLALLSPVQAL